jgi:hypothetical protein
MNEQLKHSELSEQYPLVILHLGDTHRVIQSKDNVQWIVLHESATKGSEKRYRNLNFIRAKNLLIDVCRSIQPDISSSDLDTLNKLSDVCGVLS